MKTLLLAGALLLAASPHALAKTCVIATTGNLQWYGGCASDNQANDGDDIKMFVDKTPRTVNVIDGSLGSNDQAFNNIIATTNSDFETDGSGFANFKSVDAGSTANTLTAYTFVPGPSPTLPDGTPFNGFDGQLFRGQIDNTGSGANKYNGDLFVNVTFVGGGSEHLLYTGLSDKQDFGVLGFDEVPGVDEMVKSVFISLNSDGASNGAFNEFKQIEFSVPGAIAVIPETSTWVMALLGFIGMAGYGAWRRNNHQRANSVRSSSDSMVLNS